MTMKQEEKEERQKREQIHLALTLDPILLKQLAWRFGWKEKELYLLFTLFVQKCLKCKGLPFLIGHPVPNSRCIKAILEAERIKHDRDHPGFTNMEDLFDSLNH